MSDSSAQMLRDYSLVSKAYFSQLIVSGSRVFSPIMNGYEFERCLVGVLMELSDKKGLKAAPLARAAWPQNKDAATKWRKIRNADPPQELSMRDAFEMARAIGVSMTELCGIVQGRAMEAALEREAKAAPEKKSPPQAQELAAGGPIQPHGNGASDGR